MKDKVNKFIVLIIGCVLCVITFSLIWTRRFYGNIGFEEIIFHLRMPIKGTSTTIIYSFIKNCIFPTLICLIGVRYILCSKNYHLNKLCTLILTKKIFILLVGVWILVIVLLVEVLFDFSNYVLNQFTPSNFIEDEYVSPSSVEIIFPEKKQNLIIIYIESGETSTQDKSNGGLFEKNYISEMTKIAKMNVSFSQTNLIEGASIAPACGWTIAGLVAETSGLPLKLSGYDAGKIDNSMSRYSTFMPGAITLGDILEREGYHNYFMAGSDFEFGGRENYFTQHGNYEIFDYFSAIDEGKISKDYYEWWGFEDQKLYEYAKEKIIELSKEDNPFNFSMLTVDTHHEDGYLCEQCPNNYDNQYANVWACASKQLNEFVNWIKEQDFYENTSIVILGDHCSMDSDFFEEYTYDKHHGATVRKVYNAFINAKNEPSQEKNRLFTTMDMYPTILSSLGVRIEGERLGLGTNLFSNEKTLSEIYGYETMFKELNKKSHFYDEKILFP